MGMMAGPAIYLNAAPGDPLQGIDVSIGKKPKPKQTIARTDFNGAVHFTLDAGTYTIEIRLAGSIAGVPVGATIQLAGTARAAAMGNMKSKVRKIKEGRRKDNGVESMGRRGWRVDIRS